MLGVVPGNTHSPLILHCVCSRGGVGEPLAILEIREVHTACKKVWLSRTPPSHGLNEPAWVCVDTLLEPHIALVTCHLTS